MRWRRRDATWTLAVVLPLVLAASPGEARAEPEDTSYGRIAGDLGLVVGAGAAFGPRAPRGAFDLRLRYLESAGLFLTYEDGFGGAAEPTRVFAAGTELRPLFLGRWLTGRELSRGRFDLLLDSIGLELGAAFYQPSGASFASRPALQAGLGVELPLLENATGPWIGLHGGARWSEVAMGSGDIAGADDRALFLAVTLSWHQVLVAHLVDESDRAPR
jgi:hypothetical protein